MGYKGTVPKPLPISFLFQEKNKAMEKTMQWQAMIGSFKSSREKDTNALFYFIIFVCYLIYRKRVWFNWLGMCLVTFRTWVRSQVPTPFILFFFQLSSYADYALRNTMRPQLPACHAYRKTNSRDQIW